MNNVINIQEATIVLSQETGLSEPIMSIVKSDVPAVGQLWEEQGGILAGMMTAQGDQPAYYLIVPETETKTLAWSDESKGIDGLSAFDGKANTELLVKRKGDFPAAEYCDGLEIGEFNDFYLPSRRECSLMAATVPDIFEEGYHWTSTQYSAYCAVIQDFSDGNQHDDDKDYSRRVRAVRRVTH